MSASVPGNIDCAITPEQKLELAQAWDDGGSVSAEYIAVVDAAKAVLDNQTANFKLLEEPDKDYQLKIWWADDCREGEPDECEDECAVDGPVAGTQCVDYALSDCFGYSYGMTEKMFRTSNLTPDKLIAVELLKAMKIMDEKIDRKAMSLFQAARGTNKFTAGQYTVNGLVTEVPAAAWNADLMGYLYMAAKKNKQTLPRVLTDTNFAQYKWLVEMQKTNPTGAAEMAKLTSLGDPYFDINMDDYLGTKSTFLFQGNALFIANQARNAGMNRGRKVQDPTTGVFVTRDVVASQNLPGITYDLFKSEVCVPGGDIKTSYRLQFRGGFFSNPVGCDSDRTGVLELRCV